VLALPPNEGLGRLAWLGPVVMLGAGFLLVVWWIRARGRWPEPPVDEGLAEAGSEQDGQRELRVRLQQELDHYEA